MTFFQQLLLAILLGTIVCITIWWIKILRFRAQTMHLVYLYLYILIVREVELFHLIDVNGLCTIKAIGKNGESLPLKPLSWVVKIINRSDLFDSYHLNENECKCIPNNEFLMVALQNQETIVTKGMMLRNKYNQYSHISKKFLKKYRAMLNELDIKVETLRKTKEAELQNTIT